MNNHYHDAGIHHYDDPNIITSDDLFTDAAIDLDPDFTWRDTLHFWLMAWSPLHWLRTALAWVKREVNGTGGARL